MPTDDDIDQWLRSQALDQPVEIDGASVYLKVERDGAELGVTLLQSYTRGQLDEALRLGFQSALQFEAGLGHASDAGALVLSQWLPGVGSWSEAAQPLERILNQAEMWRSALSAAKTGLTASAGGRNEQRLRMVFAGAKQ